MTDTGRTVPDALNRTGVLLVFLSAFVWSTGGMIARFIQIDDIWTVVFWRSLFAALFLLAFLVLRDGRRAAVAQFRSMGLPGIAVGLCFTSASICFVQAIAHTTVANVMLMNAGVPLIAALMGWLRFHERVSRATWGAIAAVLCGVAIMVSGPLLGGVSLSPVGDMLALAVACSFALATVITRRFATVRMTSGVCFGTIVAALIAWTQAGPVAVSAGEYGLLFAFGALNLGLGMALFASGARLIPASVAALLGTFETIAGPIWVWLIHGEIPSARTVIGGTVVLAALVVHIFLQFQRQVGAARPGVTGIPSPH